MNKKIALLIPTLLLSAQVFAGGPPVQVTEVPIGNDLAMLGISIALAGMAARVILRRTQK